MFISFDPLVFLIWFFISCVIPGAVISFSILRKEDFTFIEKAMIGIAIGFVSLPLPPFLLYLVGGVHFTYTIALASVGLMYLVALIFLWRSKLYEDLAPKQDKLKFAFSSELAIPIILLLLFALNFLVRFGSYSPVYTELDPYFYAYPAQQILTIGYNPQNDSTAWYPDMVVNHRLIPNLSYVESIWYSLYTGGGAYSNLLLADTDDLYPPIASVLAVFFIYLLVSRVSRREYGVIAAAIASFVPLFVYKLAAGEIEVQPYGFFSLFFFYAMYAISLRKKGLRLPSKNDLSFGPDLKYAALTGLAIISVALGSNAFVIAVSSLIIFVALQGILFFLRGDREELMHFIIVNLFVFMGAFLGYSLLKEIFLYGTPSFSWAVGILAPIILSIALYLIRPKLQDTQQALLVLGVIIVLGLMAYSLTPLGTIIKNIGQTGFSIAQYNAPNERTVAELGLSSAEFSSQIGFITLSYSFPPVLDSFGSLVDLVMAIVLAPSAIIVNLILSLAITAINLALGTTVTWSDKTASFLTLWLFLFFISILYCAWKFFRKEDDSMFLLFMALIMPELLVGLVKAKYALYSGVLLAVGIGFVFGQAEDVIGRFIKDEQGRKKAVAMLLLVGGFFCLMQFLFQGFAPALLWGSFQTLYQNNPNALGPKFAQFCSMTNDSDYCAAAADPMGYASKGTNYQYSEKLCLGSVFSKSEYLSNPNAAPPWEAQAAVFRCQRISDYWIDSMEWIKANTEPGSRITSWWDYGHWENFFGNRNAVIRNDQIDYDMINAVADRYIDGTPDDLKQWMIAHDSKYALFDIELISGGGTLGGKYGALNYLSCAYNNETTVAQQPGESKCESEHLWETIFVSQTPCTISSLTNKTGFVAYEIYAGDMYLSQYPTECVNPTDPSTIDYCRNVIRAVPTYCAGDVVLADGQKNIGTYYLNETYPNGDLKLNKGILQLPYQLPTTSHMGPVTAATVFYTNDRIWLENGEVKSGYEDRKGKFYDSTLYRAIFLNELPGFKLVYSSPNGGAVKIYKIG